MYPVIFCGHGTPINAIEENEFSQTWRNIAQSFKKPRLVIVISAHWVTKHLKVLADEQPRTIYDFYYFPKELYEVEYAAPGSPECAAKISELTGAQLDSSWGFDHGAWTLLNHMYPERDVKVLQLSISYPSSPQELFEIGKKLQALRYEALIIGSGNIVHNLRKADFRYEGGYTWAEKYDKMITESIINRDFNKILGFDKIPESRLAFPTLEHFQPLLYILGASKPEDKVEIFNQACVFGSISMTSYIFRS